MKNAFAMFTDEQKEKIRGLISSIASNLGDTKNLKSFAAIMGEVFKNYVEARSIGEVVLQRHDVPKGVTAKYAKPIDAFAYYTSFGSGPIQSPINSAYLLPEIDRLYSNPTFDVGVLQSGDIDTVSENVTKAGDAMVKTENAYVVALLSAALTALGASNTVTVSGGSLTMAAVDEAFALIEDQGLKVASILCRGANIRKFTATDSPEFSNELALRGAAREYSGAVIYNVPEMDADKVILIPDRIIGKLPIVNQMQSKVEESGFDVSVLNWRDQGYALLKPEWAAQVTITA